MQGIRNTLFFHNDKKGKIRNYMGVELEISNFNPAFEGQLTEVLNKWKANCGGDGSIVTYGKYPNAFEIKTAPAKGNAFVEQMTEICAVLKKGDAKANESCGLHVHIDARGFTPNDVLKIAAVWPKIENKFWTKTYEDRKDGEYCESWGEMYRRGDGETFRAGSLLDMYEQIKSNAVEGDRYMSLNFAALREFGTIENRMHHGTVNARTIIAWAGLNDRFINFTRKMKVRDAIKFDKPGKIIRTKKIDPLQRKSLDDKMHEEEEKENKRRYSREIRRGACRKQQVPYVEYTYTPNPTTYP